MPPGRSKFRSQTSDNMDRWKSRGGKSQRWEEKKREEQRRERVRRQKMQVREKVAKSRHTVFFPMICGSGGSKSRLAKAAGAEPSGEMRDEQLHAGVARSTFGSQNVQNTPGSEHFWKLRCRKCSRCGAKHISKSKRAKHTNLGALLEVEMSKKSARGRGAKHISKSKCTKNTNVGALLEVEMSKKCAPLWRKANVEVNMLKSDGPGALLDVQMSFRVAGARVLARCQKRAKREGFVAFPKTMAGVWHLKRIWKDACRVAGAVQETCSSEMLGGKGADLLRGVAFWSIRSSVLGRWFCVIGAALCNTLHDLASLIFSGRRNTSET